VYYTATTDDGRNVATKIAAAGGTPVALTPPEAGFSVGSVSRDGSLLRGSAWNDGGRRRQTATVSVNGGPIAFVENVPRGGSLAPDEKSWIIVNVIDNVPGIFVKPLEGGKERLVVSLGDDQAWRVAVSPDGKSLGVVRGRSTNDVVLIKAK